MFDNKLSVGSVLKGNSKTSITVKSENVANRIIQYAIK